MKARDLRHVDLPVAALPRFWGSISKSDGCWIWNGHRDGAGYGVFRANRMAYRASRFMHALTKGDVPADKVVCHTCDNPPCVNPDHLWLGTVADNSRDMVEKGRSSRRIGTANPRCRLTKDQVLAIRADKRRRPAIARQYGVSVTTVHDIWRGRTWSSLK